MLSPVPIFPATILGFGQAAVHLSGALALVLSGWSRRVSLAGVLLVHCELDFLGAVPGIRVLAARNGRFHRREAITR